MIANTPYEDKGLIINGSNMAAGATVYSEWYDNAEWVRNILCAVQTDQQFDIIAERKDKDGIATTSFNISSAQTAVASPNWKPYTGTGGLGIFGKIGRIGLKNSSASPNTYGRLRCQLLGL